MSKLSDAMIRALAVALNATGERVNARTWDALATRGLVEISGEGADRTVSLTEAGRTLVVELNATQTPATVATREAQAIVTNGYAAPWADRKALADKALAVGYTADGAGRLTDEAFYLGERHAPHGDECDRHPAMRRDHQGDCEACAVESEYAARNTAEAEYAVLNAHMAAEQERTGVHPVTGEASAPSARPAKVWREADIVAELAGVRHGSVTVKLLTGDAAIIPGTTKRHLVGPGTVGYYVHRDGMVEMLDVSGPTVAHTRLPEVSTLMVQACRDGGPWLDLPDAPAGDEDFMINYARGCAMLVPDSQWRVLNTRTGETMWLGPNPVTAAQIHAETSAPLVVTGVSAGAGSARSVDVDGPLRFRSGPCGKRKRFVRRGRRH